MGDTTLNKDNLNIKEESVEISLDSAKRLYMKSELYKLLQVGFGQEIAGKMSANVISTVDFARNVLLKGIA